MSAIIELRYTTDKNFEEVMRYVKKAGFRLSGDSANYLAVAAKYGDSHRADPEEIALQLYKASKGRIAGQNQNLERGKRIAKVAMSFSRTDSAETGLSTMVPALKYEPKRKQKKKIV